MFDIDREKLTVTYQGLKKDNEAVRSNQGWKKSSFKATPADKPRRTGMNAGLSFCNCERSGGFDRRRAAFLSRGLPRLRFHSAGAH